MFRASADTASCVFAAYKIISGAALYPRRSHGREGPMPRRAWGQPKRVIAVKVHAHIHVGGKVARAGVSCEVARARMSRKPHVVLTRGAVATIAHVHLQPMRLLILDHLHWCFLGGGS